VTAFFIACAILSAHMRYKMIEYKKQHYETHTDNRYHADYRRHGGGTAV
jgi:hypothetical protein